MRSITVAVCLDDRGGMLFFGRRQSRDRVLISELIQSTEGKVYINKFSELLFEPHREHVVICDDPMRECPDGGTVFVENLPLLPYFDDISQIILYKWNKNYPSDKRIDIKFDAFRVVSDTAFVGSSHDKINKVILKRR